MVLMWVAHRKKRHTSEIKFAMMLSLVDMALAGLIIFTSLTNNFTDASPESFKIFCRIKGPVDFILLYFSPLLVAIIALTRYYKVKDSYIPSFIWSGVAACTCIYAALVILATVRNEFHISLSGCDCTPIAANSSISATVLFFLGLSMLLSLMVTIFSYLSILSFIKRIQSKSGRGQIHGHHLVLIRVTTISVIYFLSIAPSSILIMLEATQITNQSSLCNVTISILDALNNIANPCLVLFVHPLIFDQLRASFQINLFNFPQSNPLPTPDGLP
ncbi:hypothetical protein DSO57_1004851 [Entomophthora muscae]|uniref:Uncharacterized protein n=1 Tax=Entomophthora muscae TaxID=34485 RepID=A0ACC2RZ69_9FUNG|nr:hypothetical protein DSO57_1004851 [Entomophthora muscae]